MGRKWFMAAEHYCRSHLSDGHVVLHVAIVLQKNKAGQDVSKMRTDSRLKSRQTGKTFCFELQLQ